MPKILRVTCAACGASNLLAKEECRGSASCDHCYQVLFAGNPLTLDAENLDNHINSDLPLIVAFSAPWYPANYSLGKTYRQAARLLEPGMRLAQIDSAAHPDLARRFNVRGVPTVVALRRGNELGRIFGLLSLTQFVHWTQQLVL